MDKEFTTEDKFRITFYNDKKEKRSSQELEINYTESSSLESAYPNLSLTVYGEDTKEVKENFNVFIDKFISQLNTLKVNVNDALKEVE